jgi:8-oxo-dGTP pyrophosphatase MutT (NUDIX family)
VRRELREELGVQLTSLTFHETVHAPAALEGVPMTMDVFRAELTGEPAAGGRSPSSPGIDAASRSRARSPRRSPR